MIQRRKKRNRMKVRHYQMIRLKRRLKKDWMLVRLVGIWEEEVFRLSWITMQVNIQIKLWNMEVQVS